MTKRILTGNEAVALGALRAGVKVATGYPGTPSTGCIAHLLTMNLPDRHVEWSTNEKVAFEIAAGAAWAGHRALCTMKMSGVNVAYDALISIAYSGTNGGFVIYVADDPGVSAGMPEQDTRGFALMSQLPMLEPSTPQESYDLVQRAFELSERTGAPVFLRSTTAIALGHAPMTPEASVAPREIEPILEKDIHRYTKAGSVICKDQHRESMQRLQQAGIVVQEMELNELSLASSSGGVGVISVGATTPYLDAALQSVDASTRAGISTLRARTTIPFPWAEAEQLLGHCETLLVLEELEPHVERGFYVAAQRLGFSNRIIGKMDGTLSPIGEYGPAEIRRGLEACGLVMDSDSAAHPSREQTEVVLARGDGLCSAPRPITVCAGCPHRGSYLAIEAAIKAAGFDKDEVMVTGDIGCTILGMNPPFDLLWNEVSMGSSVSLAQGYVHAGLQTPVIATIGDSTFFHGGIPGLINAIQHRTPLTLVVMDNGWTSMTGMQVNPGTDIEFQDAGRRVDIEAVIRGLGPDRVDVVDAYDLGGMTRTLTEALVQDGVKVVLAQRECVIQARRRGVLAGTTSVDADACVLCKRCLKITGCPALGVQQAEHQELASKSADADFSGNDTDMRTESIVIDPALCNGCGLCVRFCPTGALSHAVPEGAGT